MFSSRRFVWSKIFASEKVFKILILQLFEVLFLFLVTFVVQCKPCNLVNRIAHIRGNSCPPIFKLMNRLEKNHTREISSTRKVVRHLGLVRFLSDSLWWFHTSKNWEWQWNMRHFGISHKGLFMIKGQFIEEKRGSIIFHNFPKLKVFLHQVLWFKVWRNNIMVKLHYTWTKAYSWF